MCAMAWAESDSTTASSAENGEIWNGLVADVDMRVLEGRLRVLDMHRTLSAFQWRQFGKMLTKLDLGTTSPNGDVTGESDDVNKGCTDRLAGPGESEAEEALCSPIQACCLLGEHGAAGQTRGVPRANRSTTPHRIPESTSRSMGQPSGLPSTRAKTFAEEPRGVPCSNHRGVGTQLIAASSAQPWDGGLMGAETSGVEDTRPSYPGRQDSAINSAEPLCADVEGSEAQQGVREGRPRHRWHRRPLVPLQICDWQGSPLSSPGAPVAGTSDSFCQPGTHQEFLSPQAPLSRARRRSGFKPIARLQSKINH